MRGFLKQLLNTLLPAFLLVIVATSASANSTELNQAIEKYYAGYPEQAVDLLEPMAISGNVDAQYLLGNILYSLSETEKFKNSGDPVKWYKMAADQGVADASYALAVIYNNRWQHSKSKMEAALAIVYFQKAADSGFKKASDALNKLMLKSGISSQEATAITQMSESTVIAKLKPQLKPKKITETKKAVETKTPTVSKQEPKKPVELARMPVSAESIAESTSDGNNTAINLSELASQCNNFTPVGFNSYAESIKGALLKGTAIITKTVSTGSSSSRHQVYLMSDKYNIQVILTLQDVPDSVSSGLKKGQEMVVTGEIKDSKLLESSCTVDLLYQSTENDT